jgi:hypothetical protein
MFAPIEMMTTWLSTLGPAWGGVMIATMAAATAGLVVVTHLRTSLDVPRRAG